MRRKNLQLSVHVFLFILCFPFALNAKEVQTFYGPVEVNEPVLLELLESPTFQRLKHVHQYGVGYYTTHPEEFNRFDHSVGVFAILRKNGASVKEQIAGLLHDVSHTVFSHVGDWVFGKEHEENDYQNSTHQAFIENCELNDILQRHGFTVQEIMPTHENFPALECSVPDLCADRIDYNIQGAFHQNYITYEEALKILHDLEWDGAHWISSEPELMKKLVRYSLCGTVECWGGPRNYLSSRWLADSLLRAIELGSITFHQLHRSTDQPIWECLLDHRDPLIQKKMLQVLNADKYFHIVDRQESDLIIGSKFRGIDPIIKLENQLVRLSSLDPQIHREFLLVKQMVKEGWPVKLVESSLQEEFEEIFVASNEKEASEEN